MIELQGDMWDKKFDSWVRCITTNGSIRSDGELVMGRGNAFQAKMNYPGLAQELGTAVRDCGNVVHYIVKHGLIAFPVKYKWVEKASLFLIATSLIQLCQLIRQRGIVDVLLPRPGCGNGELSWEEDVRPLIEPIINALAPKIVIISQ